MTEEEMKVNDRYGCKDFKDESESGKYQFKYWIEDKKTGAVFFIKIKNPYFRDHDKTLNRMKRSKKLKIIGSEQFW